MGKLIAYIRTSRNTQEITNQKYEILKYAQELGVFVDQFFEVEMSSRKSTKDRQIDKLLETLNSGDTLIVSELSRLGRSTAEVIKLINDILARSIRIIILKQNLDLRNNKTDMSSKIIITLFSLFAELERDLISMRTKEALASRKAQGIKLGRPIGIVAKSKFDVHVDKIKELLSLGLSIRKISKILGFSNNIGLTHYINKKKLKDNLSVLK